MVRLTSLLRWNDYHNIPEKFIRRKMFRGVVYENVHKMTPTVVYNYTEDYIFDEHAPWTSKSADVNDPSKAGRRKRVPIVPPLLEWFFYRGDHVQIVTGRDAGKRGYINGVIRQRNWVFVEGLNNKLMARSNSDNASDLVYYQKELPLVVHRDVKLIDPTDLEPCEVVHRYTESGEKVRVSTRTNRIIPIPLAAFSTIDYAKKSDYKPGQKDTAPKDVTEVSFKAVYKTFEQDLCDQYGIKDDKVRAETYRY